MANAISTEQQVFTAGRAGKDVRSDLRVEFSPQDAGGLQIDLKSRVATYYGQAIRVQAEQVLQALGLKHCRLSIEDEGALPFVISARIEAAVRKSGLAKSARVLSEQIPLPPASARDRLRRSRLYLPGAEPKYFINAGLHDPDAIILDLEDSVHSSEKFAARLLVRNALRSVSFGDCERMVRINQLPLGLEDLEEILPEHPDLILIPKVECPEQVLEVAKAISAIGDGSHTVWLMPILESALGIENAYAIATSHPTVVALTIGLEDYTADLGVVKTLEGDESLYARTRLVNAAKAAGIQAIDSVFGDVSDMESLARWGRRSRALGFEGMGCIHPGQIPVIHEAFAPSAQEIERALKIVAAYQEAEQHGLGVVSLGSKMIDPPVVHRSLKLVSTARTMGLVAREAK